MRSLRDLSLSSVSAVLGVVLLAALCAGCGKSGGGGSTASMRFINVVPDAGGPVTINVGGNQVSNGLAFQAFTTYQTVGSGSQQFTISVVGSATNLINTTYNINGGQNYTYVMYGPSTAVAASLISDSIPTTPPSGQFNLRVTNAAANTASLDFYLTVPGAPLDNATPALSTVNYSTTSLFSVQNQGNFQMRATRHNDKTVIYDGGVFNFTQGNTYGIVVYTNGSGTLVNAILENFDSSGTGFAKPTALANFKAVHAAQGTAAINALVDGVVALSNIPYQGASAYQSVPTGPHTVTFEAITAPGATIASATPPFDPATDASIFVMGAPGQQQAIVLPDNNLPGTLGNARVRFVNASPDVGPIDVNVNFARRVANLGTGTASSYIQLTQDTYAINFDIAGTTTVVLSLPSVPLTAGYTYTIYLVGAANSLGSIQTRDN